MTTAETCGIVCITTDMEGRGYWCESCPNLTSTSTPCTECNRLEGEPCKHTNGEAMSTRAPKRPVKQQWCGQPQPHYAHGWTEIGGEQFTCAGVSGHMHAPAFQPPPSWDTTTNRPQREGK